MYVHIWIVKKSNYFRLKGMWRRMDTMALLWELFNQRITIRENTQHRVTNAKERVYMYA